MKHLSETLNESTLHVLAAHAQQYIDDQWKLIWERHLAETERIFAKGGDSAYGFYCLKLFQPLAAEIAEAGWVTQPVLPGIFPQSEEHWGPWENRERRFWSVIQQDNGKALGTLITRIFHDHTQLRLPRPPHIYAIHETDPSEISHILIHTDPDVLDSRTDGES
ncbi:DUF6022 family protein [Paenibacillus cellulositrophicus]|uniref:DUF6022 family protein n=1 Tax=Paenibacillus cellulositrophicus TaxID=562959 RepID=UPI00203D086E|nr:DUF6022 family protein [Paenibacillus cellulositrophicus]